MKSICVFCGSSDSVHPDYITAARQMGRTLAERGIRLVFGGGKTGLMGAVANGVLEAGGEVIGVIIPTMNTPALAHQGLSRMDVVDHMHSRKARMHELAEAILLCPAALVHGTNCSKQSPGHKPARTKRRLACLTFVIITTRCLPRLIMQWLR